MRKSLLIVVLLLCVGAARAADTAAPKPTPTDEYRAGWREVGLPVLGHGGKATLQARQDALMAAIPHLEAAVSADPGNVSYRVSLGHVYLAAGKYDKAEETLTEATRRERKNPLLYLLRAQAEAAIAFVKPSANEGTEAPPPTVDEKGIGKALRSFDEAARLDPANSLALIQAASVAFQAGKQDVALATLQSALARPGITLDRLPIPENLDPGRSASIKMWQHAQMWQWLELLARCQNVARTMAKHGKQKEDAGDLDGAAAVYKQVLALGKQVGNARPNMFITLNTGLNIMEDGYINLTRLAEARKSPEAAQWKGETGVLYIGRQEMVGPLQAFAKSIDDNPPASTQETLDREADSVARVMAGVGLSPTRKPAEWSAGANKPSAAPTAPPKQPATAPGPEPAPKQ